MEGCVLYEFLPTTLFYLSTRDNVTHTSRTSISRDLLYSTEEDEKQGKDQTRKVTLDICHFILPDPKDVLLFFFSFLATLLWEPKKSAKKGLL